MQPNIDTHTLHTEWMDANELHFVNSWIIAVFGLLKSVERNKKELPFKCFGVAMRFQAKRQRTKPKWSMGTGSRMTIYAKENDENTTNCMRGTLFNQNNDKYALSDIHRVNSWANKLFSTFWTFSTQLQFSNWNKHNFEYTICLRLNSLRFSSSIKFSKTHSKFMEITLDAACQHFQLSTIETNTMVASTSCNQLRWAQWVRGGLQFQDYRAII